MEKRIETLAVHGGQVPDPTTLSRAVPLYRTAAYLFKSAEHAARLFGMEEPGNIYSRLGNPTQAVLEERINLLEGGAGALASASGTSAIFSTIINIARQGDEIVTPSNLYGGTFTMFDSILPQFGITTHMVDSLDPVAVDAAITPQTRMVYVEAIGNPGLDVADLDAFAAVAHKHGLPLVVDATFVTPILLRPFEHGADIVVHSVTKWLGGHGTALGGMVVDSGRFDWSDARFELYNLPDDGYHGLRWGHDLPAGMPPFITRMRTVPLRNLGACLSPDNAWMLLQGIETLPLRMERHCANALGVAQHLLQHPQVAWVRYPGLLDDPSYPVASRLLKNGFGGMVVFGIKGAAGGSKGGKEAGQRFIESLKLFSHLANVGDAKSLAIHPGSTTHSQLTDAQQQDAGLRPELVRLSIGIEHIDDILEDLDQALACVTA
ncbi:MAG: O-acetylhomoserine aminocarboxypropyltransferase/cysteine synthase family protein [Bilophila sp.]